MKSISDELEINQVYNMDCLVGMKKIKDKSIDLILCDLPYGTTRNKWDSVIDLDLLWGEYLRIIRDNGAIVLTSAQPFTSILINSNIQHFKYCWIWEKPNGTGHLNAKKQPLRSHEDICVFYRKQPVYNPQMAQGKPYKWNSTRTHSSNYNEYKRNDGIDNKGEWYPKTVLRFPQERGLHPTQKPVSLFEYLIKTYSNENDIVLDNCMGSGTTAIACIRTGRNFIGFESDTVFGYYDVLNKRIEKEKASILH